MTRITPPARCLNHSRSPTRRLLLSAKLPLTVLVLLLVVLALAIALIVFGERRVAYELVGFAQQSNWKYARAYLETLDREPLRTERS